MTLTKKTNHVAEAVGRLIEQFKPSARLHALITSYVDQIQDLENAAFQLITDRTLDTATGVQLDGIGQIVGVERGGLNDDDYRVRLRVQINVNLSSGTIEDILTVGLLITGDTVALTEYFPATFVVTILNVTVDVELVRRIINEARAAGVSAQFIYSPYPSTETFQFSTQPATSETDANEGFANSTQTTGGRLAGVLVA